MWSNRLVPLRSVLAVALIGLSVPTVGVDAVDAGRDVTLYPKVAGPSAHDRRSIDLRRVIVTPSESSVLFRIRIARLLPDAPFDQVADVLVLPPDGADVDSAGTEIWMSTHKPRTSFANLYSTVADPVLCPRLVTVSDPATGWFSVEVPRQCLPPGEVTIQVETFATTARNDAWPYSRDVLAVPGTVVWDESAPEVG